MKTIIIRREEVVEGPPATISRLFCTGLTPADCAAAAGIRDAITSLSVDD